MFSGITTPISFNEMSIDAGDTPVPAGIKMKGLVPSMENSNVALEFEFKIIWNAGKVSVPNNVHAGDAAIDAAVGEKYAN